jgi:hypothetical protein
MMVVFEHPCCAALLHGGQRCRSATVSGSQFCEHHTRLADDHGADALRHGRHLPTRRKRVAQEPVIAEPIVANTTSAVSVDPATVRPQLAAAAAANLDDIRRVLLDTATGANKHLWVTITCKHCQRLGRYEVVVPDNKVRLDAVQALLHESLGRPGQAEPQATQVFPRTVDEARALNWDQLSLVFATQFASEIAAVVDNEGDELLRKRLAGLSDDERQVLRDALAEPAAESPSV